MKSVAFKDAAATDALTMVLEPSIPRFQLWLRPNSPCEKHEWMALCPRISSPLENKDSVLIPSAERSHRHREHLG